MAVGKGTSPSCGSDCVTLPVSATLKCPGAGCEGMSSVLNASCTLPTGKPKDEKRVEKRKRKESNRMMKQNAKYVRYTYFAIFWTL